MSMKIISLLTIGITSFYSNAQQASYTFKEVNTKNQFYTISDSSNHKLILFLHGGVTNPWFKQPQNQISLNFLIENNDDFIKQVIDSNFDLIIPITNDSLNWLNNPKESFNSLNEYIKTINKHYDEIYISGFSDGGTGSYKIFHENPEYFDGLIIFNGYPQHLNYFKNVNHSKIKNKKIIFVSTLKDKIIPFEFLLYEYCQQKKENANTYIYLAKGGHSFNSYGEKDFKEIFDILTNKVTNNKTEPIQGFVKNDQPITMYPFRKRIVKKYNFGEEIYEENVKQLKRFNK